MEMANNSLDVSSDSYDPLASIYSDDLPNPEAPLHGKKIVTFQFLVLIKRLTTYFFTDNVELFISQLSNPTPSTSSSSLSSKKGKKNAVATVQVPGRQFTEEQMPIQCQKKDQKNILGYMTNQTEGPMSILQKCVQDQVRIKVITRKLNGIRGFCTGLLVAFDKHWNLALQDVDETYSRPRFPKPEYDNGQKLAAAAEKVGESVIRIEKTRRKTQLCQRHVPQLVLRGEHVVLVQLLR